MRERTDPTKLAMLRRFTALRSAPEVELERMAAALDVVDLAAGQLLTVQGRPGRSVFLIVEGRAVAERDGSPVSALGAGDLVADVTPVHGAVRGATVQAVTPMRVLVAGPGTISTLLDGFEAALHATGAAAEAALARPPRLRWARRLSGAPA